MGKNLIVGALVVLALAISLLSYTQSLRLGASSGNEHYNPEYFYNTLTIGDGGTAIEEYVCATASWNPPNISSSTIPASTTVAVSGLASGDGLVVNLNAASSTGEWFVTANASSALAFINLSPLLNTAAYVTGLDLGTSTVEACSLQ